MRILSYEISRRGIVNIEKEAAKDRNDVIKRIIKNTPTRIAKGISDWKVATTAAESITNPSNYLLQAVYRDIEIDAHLFALMQTIILKVLANAFVIVDATTDTVDEEATAIFKKKWFRKVSIEGICSKFYGFSAVQLGDIVDGCFVNAQLVPRDYVNQRCGGVQTSLSNTKDLMLFADEPWKWWVLPIGEPEDLGLLHKAAPLVIKKKEVISAWSEAAELFGMPMRIGKTNITSPTNRANMEDMLSNMGEAAWGVFDKDDEIQLIEIAKSDFYQIYDKFIERANSELSKLILLQTGTTDEKAFVGSAGVHESIMLSAIKSYIQFHEEFTNDIVIPVAEYHGVIKPNRKIKALNEQSLSMAETIEALKVLATIFKIPVEWVEENFKIPVEEKEEITAPVNVTGSPSQVMKEVKNMYQKYFDSLKRYE